MTALRKYTFHDGKELELGKRTLVMGVLNVTPDSFSDGGKWNTHDKALRHMEEMVRDGADIIDVAEIGRHHFDRHARFLGDGACNSLALFHTSPDDDDPRGTGLRK